MIGTWDVRSWALQAKYYPYFCSYQPQHHRPCLMTNAALLSPCLNGLKCMIEGKVLHSTQIGSHSFSQCSQSGVLHKTNWCPVMTIKPTRMHKVDQSHSQWKWRRTYSINGPLYWNRSSSPLVRNPIKRSEWMMVSVIKVRRVALGLFARLFLFNVQTNCGGLLLVLVANDSVSGTGADWVQKITKVYGFIINSPV